MDEYSGQVQTAASGADLELPGLPAVRLPRPRLDRLVLAALQGGGTAWIVAAAGAGKSVLAEAVARTERGKVSWVAPGRAASVTPLLDAALAVGPALLIVDDPHGRLRAPDTAAISAAASRGCKVLVLSRGEPGQPQPVLGDAALDLTEQEIAELLSLRGDDPARAPDVYRATGGWAAGVGLLIGHPPVSARSALTEFVRTQVLDVLPEDELSVLLASSVAPSVSAELAMMLCGPGAGLAWERLLHRHLPAVVVQPSGLTPRPIMRGCLRRELLARAPAQHRELLCRYAEHLASLSQFAEATEVLLANDYPAEAARMAERAAAGLRAGPDWPTLVRWTDVLGETATVASPILLGARIRGLAAAGRFAEADDLVRSADSIDRLAPAIQADPALVGPAASVLLGHPAAAAALLDRHAGARWAPAAAYLVRVTADAGPAEPPAAVPGEPDERLLTWGLFLQGRVDEILQLAPPNPEAPVLNADLVLAAGFSGQLAQARRLWARVPDPVRRSAHGQFVQGALLYAEGHREQALALYEEAIAGGRRVGSPLTAYYEALMAMVLMTRRDSSARSLLEDRVARWARTGMVAVLEWGQMLLGWSLLNDNRDREARALLAEAVSGMDTARRWLQLPLAAACLAEAHARCGDLDASHEAAELAYRAARSTGFFAGLVRAARSYPGLVARERTRDPLDTRWRRLVICPSGPSVPQRLLVAENARDLQVQSFGTRCDLVLDGRPLGVRRLKVVELAAHLALYPEAVSRSYLQQRLLPDADPSNGGNHFRQIRHKFREATGITLLSGPDGSVGLPADVTLTAADVVFEQEAAFAGLIPGPDRLQQLQAALSLVIGPYLERSTLGWARDRGEHLDVVQEEASLEVIRLLSERGRTEEARAECEAVLRRNRYCDPAYRLLVSIERLAGEGAERRAYLRATRALGELGLEPGDARRLLDRTRPPRGHPWPVTGSGDATSRPASTLRDPLRR